MKCTDNIRESIGAIIHGEGDESDMRKAIIFSDSGKDVNNVSEVEIPPFVIALADSLSKHLLAVYYFGADRFRSWSIAEEVEIAMIRGCMEEAVGMFVRWLASLVSQMKDMVADALLDLEGSRLLVVGPSRRNRKLKVKDYSMLDSDLALIRV
ncbi:hypothetical protein [Ferrimonas marina]|uniref:Uncharacterized protein n=1 Tax=Ferrimonas marina TaxID=299255 RepID=A0A1M5UJK6_9GAMM|nr:hypothetical protein [Ferrimonas marina]SHH63101.1 hypothetical protein SAMN02745129_2600 [Ferrimonas marina]